MESVWRSDVAVTVRDVHDDVGRRRDLAYTTVMTVMDRLFRKKLLARSRGGRAYVYRAAMSREEHVASLLASTLDNAADRRGVLLGFVDAVRDDELEELERLVRAARRRSRRTR